MSARTVPTAAEARFLAAKTIRRRSRTTSTASADGIGSGVRTAWTLAARRMVWRSGVQELNRLKYGAASTHPEFKEFVYGDRGEHGAETAVAEGPSRPG